MSFTWEFVAVSNMVGDPYLNRNMGLSAVLGEAGWCHRLIECCIQNCMTTLVICLSSPCPSISFMILLYVIV
jgi:hypothetical protein